MPVIQFGFGRGLAETVAVVLEDRREREIGRAGGTQAEVERRQAEADRAKAEARIAAAEATEREAAADLALVAAAAAIAVHQQRHLGP
jgi:hypothetical protein